MQRQDFSSSMWEQICHIRSLIIISLSQTKCSFRLRSLYLMPRLLYERETSNVNIIWRKPQANNWHRRHKILNLDRWTKAIKAVGSNWEARQLRVRSLVCQNSSIRFIERGWTTINCEIDRILNIHLSS